MMFRIAFAIMCLEVSQIPIGRTTGHLSRAIRRQANRGAIPFGSTSVVQSLFSIAARAWHRSLEAVLKEGKVSSSRRHQFLMGQ